MVEVVARPYEGGHVCPEALGLRHNLEPVDGRGQRLLTIGLEHLRAPLREKLPAAHRDAALPRQLDADLRPLVVLSFEHRQRDGAEEREHVLGVPQLFPVAVPRIPEALQQRPAVGTTTSCRRGGAGTCRLYVPALGVARASPFALRRPCCVRGVFALSVLLVVPRPAPRARPRLMIRRALRTELRAYARVAFVPTIQAASRVPPW